MQSILRSYNLEFCQQPYWKTLKLLYVSVLASILFMVFTTDSSLRANERKPEHLLDGISMDYYYQSGRGIHIEFYDGMLKYEWITGPRKGHGNKDLPYNSKKIGEQLYLMNWYEASHPDFVTLVINLDTNVIYGSAILRLGTQKQFFVFEGGIIENLKRK